MSVCVVGEVMSPLDPSSQLAHKVGTYEWFATSVVEQPVSSQNFSKVGGEKVDEYRTIQIS